MASYPMDAVDAAWYHIDGPANTALITGILLTSEPLDFERVRAVYRERLVVFDRFRQRVVEGGFPLTTPRWEDVPNFDIGEQIHHIALPEPRDQRALADLISDLAGTPLPRERPLWEVHVVDGVGSGSALITRLHHCIGDGTAMMAVCAQLFDPSPAGRPPRRSRGHAPAPLSDGAPPDEYGDETNDDGDGDGEAATRGWFAPAFATLGAAARSTLAAVDATLDTLRRPQQAIDRAALLLGGAGMLIDELLKSPDPRSPLKGEFGLAKRVAWSAPVSIADVKAIGAAHDAKVNDVLVAAMTGALRKYLAGRGVAVADTTVRAMVPVDLRPPGRGHELGNHFGLVVLELAVPDRLMRTRLARTRERMAALKRSPEPVAIMALFKLFGRVPKAVEDIAVDLFGSRASLVMTNVAGPARKLYLAGSEIDRLMFWVPHPGRQMGMGVSIMSYHGEAVLGVIADAHLVPDPETITAAFNREFAQMRKAIAR